VEEGGFIGKDMQLLEALERQLYRLDGIRAASGYKLSPQARSHAYLQILTCHQECCSRSAKSNDRFVMMFAGCLGIVLLQTHRNCKMLGHQCVQRVISYQYVAALVLGV
jgi:hypothetical protein